MDTGGGSLKNIFSLVIGINLILVGGAAFIAGVVSLAKKDSSLKKSTSILYVIAGILGLSLGIFLSKT